MMPSDLDALVELDSDPEVMRWINGGRPTGREAWETTILPRWLAMNAASPGRGWLVAVERSAPHAFVGWFHLKPGHCWPDELELGYRLRRVVWGRGLATEGSRALLAHAFERLGEAKVIATTMVHNIASRRVMEKVGMRAECEFDEERWTGGGSNRAVKFGIERGEWEVR